MILEQYPQQQLPQIKAEEQEQLLAIKDKKTTIEIIQRKPILNMIRSLQSMNNVKFVQFAIRRLMEKLFNVVNVVIGITSNA